MKHRGFPAGYQDGTLTDGTLKRNRCDAFFVFRLRVGWCMLSASFD
jgi:hypothetical protein